MQVSDQFGPGARGRYGQVLGERAAFSVPSSGGLLRGSAEPGGMPERWEVWRQLPECRSLDSYPRRGTPVSEGHRGRTRAGTLADPTIQETRVTAGGYQWLCIRAELDGSAGLDSAGVPAESVFWTFDATSDDA